MRIIQTVNDTIRLLFNPKTETFRLSDFLLVRDLDENFLAQVVEVYDDKFDQESNVAKIKLIYRIVNGNELTPFDNYTPSRECEVARIKQSEIEKCINLNKKTINLGTGYFSKEPLDINTDFFENNCVIFADKFEQTNQIFENLAPRLTSIKPVLILDFSGNCKIGDIAPYVAGDNFKMPLSSNTIDYIQQKTLIRAKLETQVVLSDIFEEVKNFLEESEENYVPFPRFIKVISDQCRKTPSVELLVLISWLKKYAREGIFAKNKREFESFFKSLSKNKITIFDASNIKTEWQKEYLEYVINNINEEIFVLIRLNDNNINNDILNTIYLKKRNISFIPSFSYGYKKASNIMDFAQNYLLMPTINPKRDFAHANFQIQSLNKEAYIIFGTDTKDFIFTLENETPIKKANREDENSKMFISLNLQLEDTTPLELRPNDFELKQQEPRRRRLHEEIKLSDVLSIKKDDNKIEEKPKEDAQIIKIEEERAVIPNIKEETEKETIVEETKIEEKTVEEEKKEEQPEEPIKAETPAAEEVNQELFIEEDELDYFEEEEIKELQEETAEPEAETTEQKTLSAAAEEDDLPKIKEEEPKEQVVEPKNELEAFAITQEEEETQEEKEEAIEAEVVEEIPSEAEEKTEVEAEEALAEEETETEEQTEEDVELDKQFAEIMEEEAQTDEGKEVIKVDKNISIDLDKIKKEAKKQENKLPVFNEEDNNEINIEDYQEGSKVSHEKYGEGEIVKVIQYGTRCLLQIEFPEVGKRLLDPKIAKLSLVE